MIVGLTGGVATGKSLVSTELERLGARVVDADVTAREVVEPGSPVLKEIAREFGPEAIKDDGTLDRAYVGGIVFSDPARLKRLNAITHPTIRRRLRAEAEGVRKADPGALVVLDVALLIENGLDAEVDRVVVVYADRKTQVRRLIARNGLDAERARDMVDSQMPVSEKAARADYVIDNTGTREETLERTRALYLELTSQAADKQRR